MKEEYYFAREMGNTPIYQFAEHLDGAIPESIFTYPNSALSLEPEFAPKNKHDIPDFIEMPSFSLSKSLFDQLALAPIYGVNWVPVTLNDQGPHDFMMLQVANLHKVFDMELSKYKRHRVDDNGDEMVSGIHKLVMKKSFFADVPKEKRLIFYDPTWMKDIFFHSDFVSKIQSLNPKNLTFISAENYSDF